MKKNIPITLLSRDSRGLKVDYLVVMLLKIDTKLEISFLPSNELSALYGKVKASFSKLVTLQAGMDKNIYTLFEHVMQVTLEDAKEFSLKTVAVRLPIEMEEVFRTHGELFDALTCKAIESVEPYLLEEIFFFFEQPQGGLFEKNVSPGGVFITEIPEIV